MLNLFFLKEISFDVFLQVVWLDQRLKPTSAHLEPKHYIELTMEKRNKIWVPDLYIRQLREMKILKVFEEISSLRIYENSSISLSIGATIIIKCDMDFSLYPLDVQFCPVDFSSCRILLRFSKKCKVSQNATCPITKKYSQIIHETIADSVRTRIGEISENFKIFLKCSIIQLRNSHFF